MAAIGHIFVEFVDWEFLRKFETIPCFFKVDKINILLLKTYVH